MKIWLPVKQAWVDFSNEKSFQNRPWGGPREAPGDVWVGPGGSRGMVETLFEKRMEIYENLDRFLLIPGAAGGPS